MVTHKHPLSLSLSKATLFGCLVVLAACSKRAADLPVGESVDCALDGSDEFEPICSIEDGGYQDRLPVVVIHDPSGKFRRFVQPGDGTFRTADGVEQALELRKLSEKQNGAVTETEFELSIDRDRYRLVSKMVADRAHAVRP